MNKIINIRKKIRAFTAQTPSNNGITVSDYKHYLASCSKLLEFDIQLSDIENQNLTEEQAEELLTEIEKEVNYIVGNK